MESRRILTCMAFLAAFLAALLSPPVASLEFNCPLLPAPQPALTIYELKPQHIKVVMALGDSVTAGFGMLGSHGSNVTEDLAEYRGQSWNIGMDDGALTVPNFLRHYGNKIVGGSLGNHLVEFCYNVICPPYQYRPSQDVFNAAQSGAMASNLVSHEFAYLLDQLKKNEQVDMKNDWKLLTIFIGINDFCRGCSGKYPHINPDDYDKDLREVLEEVRTNIPKVFVNLVLLGNLSEIYTLSLKSAYCKDIHRFFPIECICAFTSGAAGDQTRKEMDDMVQAANSKMRQIESDYAAKRYSDFAVVAQPFMSESRAEDFPVEYLSTLDCFHPSLVANQNMAKALWNNMISPKAQKKTSFHSNDPYKCPTNTTLLYTY